MYICPKCGNKNKVFTYVSEGACHYTLGENDNLTRTSIEVYDESEYFCAECPGSVVMKYEK